MTITERYKKHIKDKDFEDTWVARQAFKAGIGYGAESRDAEIESLKAENEKLWDKATKQIAATQSALDDARAENEKLQEKIDDIYRYGI